MKWLLIIGIALGAGIFILGCRSTRGSYETASYRVLRTEGDFELRDYPALLVVETPMAGTKDEEGSFMRLFRFIGGANAARQEISMTTPVLISGESHARTMAFVLPAKMKQEEAPQPSDDSVKLRELQAGRFAVLRFSGDRDAKNETEALGRLRAWMDAHRIKSTAPEPVFGYFDPPWTPSFLRRNEVMLRAEHKL